MSKIEVISPGNYEPHNHFYPKVQNAQLHPMVKFFLHMKPEQIAQRYVYLNPRVNKKVLLEALHYQPEYFRWAGTDLMHVTTGTGLDKMVVIETNSCPSGQKSFPLLDDMKEMGGYKFLLKNTFLPLVNKVGIEGKLAVFYDKNYMEVSAYAAVLAELTNEEVYLVPYFENDKNEEVSIEDGIFLINLNGKKQPLRAIFRYVTEAPWTRLPVKTKTLVFNPIICCLAGGRNKLIAAKAYDFFNAELEEANIQIATPHTIWNVHKAEIPIWMERFGYKAVVKVPYSHAGQGIYVITSKKELDQFMEEESRYEEFIVQQLIGHRMWSSRYGKQVYYHVGTIPNNRGDIYVFDIRMMVAQHPEGLRPIAIYSRRTHKPLSSNLKSVEDPSGELVTNLSYKKEDGTWGSDDSRLYLMDRKDFNTLGLSIDDLISGYIQTVLAVTAIDRMAQKLISTKGTLKRRLYRSLNNDPVLLEEIMR